MARKWILNDNELRMGHVDLHKELRSGKDPVTGGGYFYWIESQRVMLLYSKSQDFGPITEEQFKAMELDLSIERRDLTIHFSLKDSLEDAMNEFLEGKTIKYEGKTITKN